MCPLTMLFGGETAEVVGMQSRGDRHAAGGCSVHGDCSCHRNGARHGRGGHSSRLAEMGFSRGQVVEVLQNNPGVPLLLRIGDSKIALDRRTAMEIIVRRFSK